MRLIDADKATGILHTILDPLASKKLIWLAWDVILEDCETIEIRHGKWIYATEDWRQQIEWLKCSLCDFPTSTAYKYCPNCGARMDEDEISNIAKESADKISKALDKVRAKGMQKQNIKEDDEP